MNLWVVERLSWRELQLLINRYMVESSIFAEEVYNDAIQNLKTTMWLKFPPKIWIALWELQNLQSLSNCYFPTKDKRAKDFICYECFALLKPVNSILRVWCFVVEIVYLEFNFYAKRSKQTVYVSVRESISVAKTSCT